RELAVVSAAIARGERPTIPAATGGLEVGQLSAAMRTMQSAVAKREDELQLLARTGEALSGTLDYDESLRRAARVAIPDFADWCVVDVTESGAITRAAIAMADPSLEGLGRELRERFPPSQPANPNGPIPQAIASRQPILRSDIDEEFLQRVSRHPEELELFHPLGPLSFNTLQLNDGTRPIGAVTFLTSTSGRRY